MTVYVPNSKDYYLTRKQQLELHTHRKTVNCMVYRMGLPKYMEYLRKYNNVRYYLDPLRQIKHNRDWRAKNRKHFLSHAKEYNKTWYAKAENKQKIKKCQLKRRIIAQTVKESTDPAINLEYKISNLIAIRKHRVLTDKEHKQLREFRNELKTLGRVKLVRYQGKVTKGIVRKVTDFCHTEKECRKCAEKLGKKHFKKDFKIKITKIEV